MSLSTGISRLEWIEKKIIKKVKRALEFTTHIFDLLLEIDIAYSTTLLVKNSILY